MASFRKYPAGFVVPAQPVEREAPPAGVDWVHEIKHDGYRMIIRRDGDIVRLYSRKAIDWTTRLPAIKRAWDVVVDRLIEVAIVALLALAAGVPWVAGFCNWFGRVLH